MSSCCAYIIGGLVQIAYLGAFVTGTDLGYNTWQYWILAAPVSVLIYAITFFTVEHWSKP